MGKSRSFMGTWNSYPDNYEDTLRTFDKFVFQKEIGASGNEHIQFAVYCQNPRSFEAMKKRLPGAHIEVAQNWQACVNYCRKSETAVAGTLVDNVKKRKVKDPLDGRELLPLQQIVMDIVESEPDDRTIYWVTDLKGGSGKTSLAKSLCINHDDCIYISGKASDMKYGVMCWLKKHNLKTVLVDLARSQEGFVSYQGIEEVKNGVYYNTKYESEMVLFDCPHVIIFSNFEPELDKLSEDRWRIIRVEDDQSISVCTS